MKLKGDRLLIKDTPIAEVKKGGLIVSTQSTEDKKFSAYELLDGEIIYVGEETTGYKVGTKVKYTKTAGTPIMIEGNEYRLIKPEGIIFEI